MSATAVRIPMPLSSDEIKFGIAKKMAAEFETEVLKSLGRTCSLNHTSFSKFSAKWSIAFHLDDFGRVTEGVIGGAVGEPIPEAEAETIEGAIEPMPPDKFRRETTQPIPAPQVVQQKPAPDGGMTRAPRRSTRTKKTA